MHVMKIEWDKFMQSSQHYDGTQKAFSIIIVSFFPPHLCLLVGG